MESVRQDARPRAPALVKTTNFSGPPAGFPLFFPAGISLPPMDAGGTFLPPAFRQRRLCLYPRIFCPAPPFSPPDRFPPGAASPGIWTSHLFRFLPLPDGEFLVPARLCRLWRSFSLFRMGNSSCRRIRSSAGFFVSFPQRLSRVVPPAVLAHGRFSF